MDTKETNSQYQQDWEKEIADKNLNELINIVANESVYNHAFVELARQRLMSMEDYDASALEARKAEINARKLAQKESEEVKMSGWLMLFMAGLALSSLVVCFKTIQSISLETYGYNLPFMVCDLLVVVGVAILGGYTFVALYNRWDNAIPLTKIYLWISIFINIISLLNLADKVNPIDFAFMRTVWGIILAVLWFLYFKYSKRILARYPEKKRKLLQRDRYLIGTLITIPLILLVWGFFYTPTTPTLSVAEGIDTTEIDRSGYLIDKEKLNKNEVTDGISIVLLPEGVVCKDVDLEDGVKAFYLLDEKDESSYEIRIISGLEESFNAMTFDNSWNVRKEHEVEDVPTEIILDEVSDLNNLKCYRRTALCQSISPFMWDYIIIFDYKTHKFCWINAVYPKDGNVPIDKVLNNIRFEQ